MTKSDNFSGFWWKIKINKKFTMKNPRQVVLIMSGGDDWIQDGEMKERGMRG